MKTIIFIFLVMFIIVVLLGLSWEIRSGFVGIGPEAIYFFDCSTGEKLWVNNSLDDVLGWHDALPIINNQPKCDRTSMPCKHQLVMVEVNVLNFFIGNKGHLGKYDGDVYIVKINDSSVFDKAMCAATE